MIDALNHSGISLNQRKMALQRALRSQPYFLQVPIHIDASATSGIYTGKSEPIGQDFYITDIQHNISRTEQLLAGGVTAGTPFITRLYDNNQESVYQYDLGDKVFPAFYGYDSRSVAPVFPPIATHYPCFQWEYPSRPLYQNDILYNEIQTPLAHSTLECIFLTICKGYIPLNAINITDIEHEQINDSLNKSVQWEYFHTVYTENELGLAGNTTPIQHVISNDSSTRLILGTSIIGAQVGSSDAPTLKFTDLGRQLTWQSDPIPASFWCNLTDQQEAHIYFLPIEYYFPPLAQIQVELINDGGDLRPIEVGFLTRTI